MTIFTNRHRSGLICDKKQNVIELFWHAYQGGCYAGGCFRWRCFPHVHVIAGCIGDGSGMCHLLIAQCGHLWFLHISGSYWTTCRDPVVPHVSFLLAHVSCCSWITCHFFIGSSVVFLWSTWRDHNTPQFFLLLDHVSRSCTFVC